MHGNVYAPKIILCVHLCLYTATCFSSSLQDLDVDPKEMNRETPEETGIYFLSRSLPQHCLYTRVSSLQKLRVKNAVKLEKFSWVSVRYQVMQIYWYRYFLLLKAAYVLSCGGEQSRFNIQIYIFNIFNQSAKVTANDDQLQFNQYWISDLISLLYTWIFWKDSASELCLCVSGVWMLTHFFCCSSKFSFLWFFVMCLWCCHRSEQPSYMHRSSRHFHSLLWNSSNGAPLSFSQVSD